MNARKIILLSGIIALIISSCAKYLDPLPNGDRSDTDIWDYQTYVQGLVGQCYNSMPVNYNDNEGAYLDGATDNAVLTSPTHVLNYLAGGNLVTSQDPFLTYWNRDYRMIYLLNVFLKDRKGFNTNYYLKTTAYRLDSIVRWRSQGEAFALRAWFEWDLLKKFGGKGIDGTMLGFPIVLSPIDINSETNLARNTYDDCVKQIIADCDSAYKYLPIAHRDFLVPVLGDRVVAGSICYGRFDGITTRAMKADVYLTWASPRFNPNNDMSRWDLAAVNAKEVMDFKLTVDQITSTNSFRPITQVNWFNINFGGIVLPSRAQATNDDMERMFYPGGFQGNGVIGASQDLVDAFPDSLGYPITHPSTVYNPAKPYAKRDPRFYSAIFYNGAKAYRNNTATAPNLMYTFESWSNGGKDATGVIPTNTLTNYYIKKFVYMALNWSDPSISRTSHAKYYFEWADMCLAFAEAANQVVGPTDAARYGISATTAIQYLRARKTDDGANGISPAVPGAPDAYLALVAGQGKDAFDALVRNERRITTCFEGKRIYDLRRWTTDLTAFNKAVHGAGITQNPDLSFSYNLHYVVKQRNYTSAYFPIPYTEMLRMSKLVQNEGWSSWN